VTTFSEFKPMYIMKKWTDSSRQIVNSSNQAEACMISLYNDNSKSLSPFYDINLNLVPPFRFLSFLFPTARNHLYCQWVHVFNQP